MGGVARGLSPLLDDVRGTIRRHAMLAAGDRVVVGVSGGADSVALLHLLRLLTPEFRLTLHVLHVDHQLRADSARDADFVRALGRRLDVPVDVVAVDVERRGSLEAAAREGRNIMDPSIACARAGVTTGEWGETLRRVFGEYRAPTGVARVTSGTDQALDAIRVRVEALSRQLGAPMKMLVGKPGLDGHSNGAEQIAVRARDCGMEVVYEGIRLTPAQIVRAALDEAVHVVGLSILSGSHVPLVQDVMARMRKDGLDDVPVIVGGIIPPEDAAALKKMGVAAVYTPKNFELNTIMREIVELVDRLPAAA